MPLEENSYIVPHLKAPNSGQKLSGCGSALSLWNALLKISILLHYMASDYNRLFIAVSIWNSKTLNNNHMLKARWSTKHNIKTLNKEQILEHFKKYLRCLDYFRLDRHQYFLLKYKIDILLWVKVMLFDSKMDSRLWLSIMVNWIFEFLAWVSKISNFLTLK